MNRLVCRDTTTRFPIVLKIHTAKYIRRVLINNQQQNAIESSADRQNKKMIVERMDGDALSGVIYKNQSSLSIMILSKFEICTTTTTRMRVCTKMKHPTFV